MELCRFIVTTKF
uniref:Uncharacterized protein n=1 Tax=Rhizophora mucronata TaxID=61149 RepID=A0A2P2LQ42_RHIMU